MKHLVPLFSVVLLATAPAARAQVLIEDFTSVLTSTTTRYFGTWADGNAAPYVGSANPNLGFTNSGGTLNVTGSSPTPNNADTSKLVFFHFAPFLSIGSNTLLSVTAQPLTGNVANSFKITLFSFGGGDAFATFTIANSFPTGSYSTATSPLTFGPGSFYPDSIYEVRISGDLHDGSDAFKMSFDNISAVPEPSTYGALFGASVFGVVVVVRRRRKA